MVTLLPPPEAVAELRAALTGDPPQIPSKYFYDARGSELFEAITRTPEYYSTRTEAAILEAFADEVVAAVRPEELAEIGSGASRKTRLLLDAMVRAGAGRRCALLDIAEPFLRASVDALARAYPTLDVRGVVGDFQHHLDALGPGGRRLLVFLAGTLGNLDRAQVAAFLAQVRRLLAPDDAFLLGVDLVKDRTRLEAAYNDAAGVTAAFNLNILRAVDARFGGDFDVDDFAHHAFWNADEARIEMWLRARRPVAARLEALDLTVRLPEGGAIRTEISCKYTRASLEERLAAAGLRLARWRTDPDGLFAVALIRRADAAGAQA